MRPDLARRVAGYPVPKADRPVLPCGRQGRAIWAENRGEDVGLVTRERGTKGLAGARIEETDRRVAARRHDARAISAVRDPPDVAHAPFVHGDRSSERFGGCRVPEADRAVAVCRGYCVTARAERNSLHSEAWRIGSGVFRPPNPSASAATMPRRHRHRHVRRRLRLRHRPDRRLLHVGPPPPPLKTGSPMMVERSARLLARRPLLVARDAVLFQLRVERGSPDTQPSRGLGSIATRALQGSEDQAPLHGGERLARFAANRGGGRPSHRSGADSTMLTARPSGPMASQ